MNYDFVTIGARKMQKLQKDTETEREREMSPTLSPKCLQKELSWQAVGWIQRDTFSA